MTFCPNCDLQHCLCGETITVWAIESKCLGGGPLHRSRREAIDEKLEILKGDPQDHVRIVESKMKAEDYAALPEHQGY